MTTIASLRSQVAELERRTRPAPTPSPFDSLTTSEHRNAICTILGWTADDLAELGPRLFFDVRAELARRDSRVTP